jgi:hypothetical protein
MIVTVNFVREFRYKKELNFASRRRYNSPICMCKFIIFPGDLPSNPSYKREQREGKRKETEERGMERTRKGKTMGRGTEREMSGREERASVQNLKFWLFLCAD